MSAAAKQRFPLGPAGRVILAGGVIASTPPAWAGGPWTLILQSPEGPLTVLVPKEARSAVRVAKAAQAGDFIVAEGRLVPKGGHCDVQVKYLLSTREVYFSRGRESPKTTCPATSNHQTGARYDEKHNR